VQSVWVWIGCVYLVNGESDAPAAEEQRAPANGWCDLETLSVNISQEGRTKSCIEREAIAIPRASGRVERILRV